MRQEVSGAVHDQVLVELQGRRVQERCRVEENLAALQGDGPVARDPEGGPGV